MSYILDALKKSERERTVVRGLGFSDAGWRPSHDIDWVRWTIVGSAVMIVVVAAIVFLMRERMATVENPAPTVSSVPSPADTTVVATPPSSSVAVTASPLTEATIASPVVTPLITSDAEAMFLESMPPEFRQTVPAMTVNIHVYVPDEARRILYINNKPYHRGDEIPGGVRVEEIVQDGVVLQYNGQRFKLTRPS